MGMTYVSLFSGIEAASVAWGPLGWTPLAFAEIEPFPSKVLAARFPDVPNLGDVTKVDWSPYRGADVVVGGSPCQSWSIAGNRRGMDDPRGRLMLEYVRAVRDIRPRWMVWENVPGVLSQDGGRAFATLLGELEECGYCLAWRVLDAQFFGVAQRRRRVFLVGGPTVGRAAAVLFEPGCVPGSSGASRAKRASLARAAGERAQGEGGGCLTPGEHQSQCIWGADGPAPTLPSRSEHSGDHTPAIAFKPHKAASSGTPSIGDDQSPTLMSDTHQPAVAFKPDKAATSGSQSVSIEQSPSLMSSHHAPAVAFVHFAGSKTRSIGYGEELSPTLTDSSAHQPAVAFCQNTRDEVRLMGGGGQVAGALCAEPGMKQQTYVAYRKDGEDDGEDG